MGDDDLDLLHVGIIAGMTTDVTGFVACDCAADRVPPPGGLVPPPTADGSALPRSAGPRQVDREVQAACRRGR
jgi:hypothetical protein